MLADEIEDLDTTTPDSADTGVVPELWRKRPKCPYTLYVVVMALIDAAAVTFIRWGMYSEPKYDDPNADYQDSRQRKRPTHQIRDANVARRRQAQLAS